MDLESTGVSIGTALTVLSMAFGVWAWVVAWGVRVIRSEVQDMRASTREMGTTLTAHVNQTERRLTMLETEFSFIKIAVQKGAEKGMG